MAIVTRKRKASIISEQMNNEPKRTTIDYSQQLEGFIFKIIFIKKKFSFIFFSLRNENSIYKKQFKSPIE